MEVLSYIFLKKQFWRKKRVKKSIHYSQFCACDFNRISVFLIITIIIIIMIIIIIIIMIIIITIIIITLFYKGRSLSRSLNDFP